MSDMRKLKVRETGDFYAKKTKPVLILSGKWLLQMGFTPGQHVTVEETPDGILIKRSN